MHDAVPVKDATFDIAGRTIGGAAAPYVIAEASGNHNGEIERLIKLIDAAKDAGADAVKMQTYTPDTITLDVDRPEFRITGGLWDGRRLYDLYREAHTPFDWHEKAFAHARKIGITVFSSPFDASAVELLAKLDAPAYKIASFEAVDLDLIRTAAAHGKPLIMSTGMASLGEIAEAVDAARSGGAAGIGLFHCISAYPAPIGEANLRTIPHMAGAFGVPTGLSDHTLGDAAAVAATALGAAMIEKHFTLARADGGPDAAFSLEPHELKRMIASVRDAHAALGAPSYDLQPSEEGSKVFRRSLYVTADMKAGEAFSRANVRSVRPGFGLAPRHLDQVLRSRAKRDLKRGEALAWSMIDLAD